MGGALSDSCARMLALLKTPRTRNWSLSRTMPAIGSTPKSTSPLSTATCVGLPPPKGMRLNFDCVALPSVRMPIEAGCGMRLVGKFVGRLLQGIHDHLGTHVPEEQVMAIPLALLNVKCVADLPRGARMELVFEGLAEQFRPDRVERP